MSRGARIHGSMSFFGRRPFGHARDLPCQEKLGHRLKGKERRRLLVRPVQTGEVTDMGAHLLMSKEHQQTKDLGGSAIEF